MRAIYKRGDGLPMPFQQLATGVGSFASIARRDFLARK